MLTSVRESFVIREITVTAGVILVIAGSKEQYITKKMKKEKEKRARTHYHSVVKTFVIIGKRFNLPGN